MCAEQIDGRSLAVDSTRTADGLFRSLVRRSGTHCQMNSEIRRVMSTASSSSLKQSCSALTSATSALEVIFNVMRSINPRFTYFAYLLSSMWPIRMSALWSEKSSTYNGVGSVGTGCDCAFTYQPSANDTKDSTDMSDTSYGYILPWWYLINIRTTFITIHH